MRLTYDNKILFTLTGSRPGQFLTRSIPGQGTGLGCRGVRSKWSVSLSHIYVSLLLFLLPFPSL